ncbi:glutamine synthetase family protein [Nocardioides panacis]|uniref:Glutamine synthetase family protein n=1 Tax=Nocardioides panacis TaxID=2849501 RepID=A0A975SZF3_9ACTN|nr:glutamine synthetase family protein [Nocardioides panacis]QWZ08686.1 glutamine synthetase family protein [Nocardioides panacis]
MDTKWREKQERSAHARVAALAEDGVDGVALSYVDNAGVTRVKTVPLAGLPRASAWGVGMSPVFDVFCVDDSITSGRLAGGPGGDLRLYPDLDRLVSLAAQPGWAWAPVDRYTQDGEQHPGCQRGFARRAAAEAADDGLEVKMGFEVEWVVGTDVDGELRPACSGPAYGMTRLVELSDYCHDVLTALAAESVDVLQLHPEYAAGQFELSARPLDPVGAADQVLLVRETVRAVSHRHGLQASFAPVVVAGSVGNGQHLHLSLRHGGVNLLDGGYGRHGMTGEGESFLAGVLEAMPALTAVLAPSVGSHLRLVPSRWAGAYRCWGRENREAALRLVTGSTGETHAAANAEVKCLDASANPYLAVGAILTVGVASLDKGLTLPEEVGGDPDALDPAELQRLGVQRLPETVAAALACLDENDLLKNAMGDYLYDAFTAVRRAEAAHFADSSPEHVVAATRWRY